METIEVGYINSRYNLSGDFIEDDDFYLKNIKAVADSLVKNRKEKPIILLSGPSGSGKTTTAELIEKYLNGIGVETYKVSLDDYFTTVGGRKVDYEAPNRINAELLTQDINKLINCETVRLPAFDFKNEVSYLSDVELKRKEGELVIFEGIHALNPEVVKIKNGTSKIYVDVSVIIRYGNESISGEYIRLMRRMFRDSLYRGRDVLKTLRFFKSVEDGTSKYLLPYKASADYELNSFTPYEPTLYKESLSDELNKIFKDLSGDELFIAKKLKGFFDCVKGRDFSSVPENSIIREFIGK